MNYEEKAMADTSSPPNEQRYPNSLQKKFRKAILLLYVVFVVVSIPIIYASTYYQALGAANKELALLVDMITAVRKYISTDVRADLMKANLFQSPAISSTVTTAKVAGHFREMRPDYYIKVASDNPLNSNNKPEPLERETLNRFRADDKLERIVEVGVIKDKKYLVSAKPSHAKQGCLVCHGEPNAAPEAIKAAYGTGYGYRYKVGSVVGTIVVGVPFSDITSLVLSRSIIAVGVLSLIFGIIFLTVSSIVKRQIVQPVKHITDIAIGISNGDLNRHVDVRRDGSEIGELGQAFQLMARSLSIAMRKMRE